MQNAWKVVDLLFTIKAVHFELIIIMHLASTAPISNTKYGEKLAQNLPD